MTGDLDKVLESGGFAVKGWTSNKVLTNTENQERGFKMFQEEVEEKVLGVIWNYVTDEFSFKVKVDLPRLTGHSVDLGIKMTKRTLLSQVAGLLRPDWIRCCIRHQSQNRLARAVANWSSLGR